MFLREVDRIESLYRDEFERSMYHRANSLMFTMMGVASLAVAALIAWQGLPYLSTAPIIAWSIVNIVGTLWL